MTRVVVEGRVPEETPHLQELLREITESLEDGGSGGSVFTNVVTEGADRTGATDNASIVQQIIDNATAGDTIWFPRGTYRFDSGILIDAKLRIHLRGDRGAVLLFTDGVYDAITIDNAASQCSVSDLVIEGDEPSAPTLTSLIKIDGNSAYITIQNCDLRRASTAILAGSTYIFKMLGNRISNAYTFYDQSTGSTTDTLMLGETYGTAVNSGTASLVRFKGVQTRMVGCYFETQVTANKYSVEVLTGAQRAAITGCQFADSGGILTGTSTETAITGCTFSDCDNHGLSYIIRVGGGSNAAVVGNVINLPAGTTMAQVISVSGGGTVVGNSISRGVVGIQVSGTAAVSGNNIANCTTGISFPVGATNCGLGVNAFASCTTNVSNASSQVITHRGSGTPEGVLTAGIGSLYTRTDGGASTTLYIKESGTGNTGWRAV